MTATIMLTLNNTIKIVVPDSLDLITPYVLQEQQDWFEDEIKFLRFLLQPGQKVIDIGANYGVYTLSMAETVGETGKIWAFEPASTTAELLAASVGFNDFNQVIIDRSALSCASGIAELALHNNSELNSLIHDNTGTINTETVKISTLDECLHKYDWQKIDFIKIDAEGEEINILQGGQQFFDRLSPLVQYEVKVNNAVDLEIVKAFAKKGYNSYRLVPGLNILVPFDLNEEVDEFLLNLFCCKQDRAEQLVSQGFLLDAAMIATGGEAVINLAKRIKTCDRYSWQTTIAKLPYGEELKNMWQQSTVEDDFDKLSDSLSFYALSCDQQLSNKERFLALQSSFRQIQTLCENNSAHLRLSTLARIATDFGARSVAVKALSQLCQIISNEQNVDIAEPFLVSKSEFDNIYPSKNIGVWIFASVLEQIECLCAYSSFYSGLSSQQDLEFICSLGLKREEMSRRLSLIQRRFNLPISQLQGSDMN
jgi:FkbM family methyltransferase